MPRRLLLTIGVVMILCSAPPARAETINCTIARGNLCFPTSCSNSARTERLALDLEANTYNYCPSRTDDRTCIAAPMTFVIRDTSIVGVSSEGQEASARSVFLNRNTGSLTMSLLAPGGVVSIGFGNCQLSR